MPSGRISSVLSVLIVSLLLAGCGKARQEKALRERAQQLIGLLCRGETDACLEYADPIYLRAQGSGGAKLAFGIMGALLKLGKHTEQTVRIDGVDLGDNGTTATVRLSLLDQGQWKPMNPSKWVYSDGKWYMTF